MVSAINGHYKTSTLKGNHTSGGSNAISFSILEHIFIIYIFPLMFYFHLFFTEFNIHFILFFTTVPITVTISII